MLARRGLIGCPCPVPVSLTSSLPSSMTPTWIHFPIRRSTLADVDFQDPPRGSGTDHPSHFVQRLMLSPSGSKPVGVTEKILLVDSVQQVHHHLLHNLILQDRNRDRSLFPVLFRDIDPAEWLNLILAAFEPLMELPDVLLGVGLVLFIRDPVDSRTGILS